MTVFPRSLSRRLGLLTGCLLVVGIATAASAQAPLTNVADIRALPREVAARHLPVKVRGVVSFAYRSKTQSFVLHDFNQGIWVNVVDAVKVGSLKPGDLPEPRKRGMLLEVEGVTAPGGFAPVILPNHLRIVGTAAPPAAVEVTLAQLMTGRFDSQQVSLEGLVQRVEKPADFNGEDHIQLLFATEGGGHFVAFALESDGFDPATLVDALVRLRGTALHYFNRRGEVLGLRLQLTDRRDLEILRPPPADPFSAPEVSLENLKSFSVESPSLHRRRIRGVVTLSRPAEFFYLQSGDRAVRVTSTQPEPLAVGDEVEAVGFVEVSQTYAELREALFRKVGTARPPTAAPLNWQLATQPLVPLRELEPVDFDGRLVSLEGRLERTETVPGNPVRLFLDHQGHTIVASFARQLPAAFTGDLRVGSDVVVTGICVMTLASAWPALESAQPTGFRILLRAPSDVAVLRAPSWWTAGRLLGALAVTVVVLVLALGGVLVLGRIVAKQASRLVAEQQAQHDTIVEFKATLRERNRLAADLHDTMEQDLTAVALQLEAARVLREEQPAEAVKRTEFAYELLDRSRDGRRRSVWSMRVGVLEGRAFEDALRELTSRTERTYSVPCSCKVDTDGTRVPEFAANHLLLLVQEAVTNALKHSSPKVVSITGRIESRNVTLVVADDGKGFDPQHAPGPKAGHFGLLGMKERLHALGGKLDLQSAPGRGTRVEVNIPLNPAAGDS